MLDSTRRAVAAVLMALGFAVIAAAVGYGLTPVRVAPDTNCGTGFNYNGGDALTSSGDETCQLEQSNRHAATLGLLVGGIALMAVGKTTTWAYKPGVTYGDEPEPKEDEAPPVPRGQAYRGKRFGRPRR